MDRPVERHPLQRIAALGALIGAVGFAVLVVVLHILKPDVDATQRHVSQYALGTAGGWMTAAFLLLGSGLVGLSTALRGTLAKGWSLVVPLILALSGLGFLVAGVFTTDPSVGGAPSTDAGRAHNVGGYAGLLLLLASILVFPFAVRRSPAWAGHGRTAWPFAAAGVLGFLSMPVLETLGAPGVGSRIYITVAIVWIASTAAALAIRLRRPREVPAMGAPARAS